jgi:hypothetical protein
MSMLQVRPLVALIAVASIVAVPPASANEVIMSCERAGKSYIVAYDTRAKSFRTDNAQLGTRFRINRAQVDKDAVLVWVTALNFPTERDVLIQFGKDPWVRYFFGNGSQVTDRCR